MEVSAQLHASALLLVARNPNTHGLEAGWAEGTFWKFWREKNLLPILGFKNQIIQSIV